MAVAESERWLHHVGVPEHLRGRGSQLHIRGRTEEVVLVGG
jgi:hypothetical protein